MKLLDLFCGAGGAAMGYYRAGFTDITGVDINPQPRYPFKFIRADAMTFPLEGYDLIHASPPCQAYSVMSGDHDHPDLYDAIRTRLLESGMPFVIENVIGAPYKHGVVLCGSMFGLVVRRHRNFETRDLILHDMYCDHKKQGRPITVTGHGGGRRSSRHTDKGIHAEWPTYMGMEWAKPEECTQAIPPAYTEWIGKRILA